jgi:hypothetical protein
MLRATTPSAWTATVESGAAGSKGTGAARSSSSGSACALSSLRTRPPKEIRDERRTDPGATKNDEGSLVYLTLKITALLASQLEREEVLFPLPAESGRPPDVARKLTGTFQGTSRGVG